MKLSDIETVQALERSLNAAQRVLAKFEAAPGPTVPTMAHLGGDFGRGGAEVELLPVPKEVAVSAARRAVSKVLAELHALGVTVDADHPAD